MLIFLTWGKILYLARNQDNKYLATEDFVIEESSIGCCAGLSGAFAGSRSFGLSSKIAECPGSESFTKLDRTVTQAGSWGRG